MSSFQATSSGFPFANPDLAKPWMDLKLPSLTLATLIEAQHKNAAALGNANQVAFDGLKTLLQRQGFLLTTSVETCTRLTSDLLAAGSFEERAAKQADATRDTYFSVVARMRELSDIVIEANMAAIGIVNARIIEAFSDLRVLFAPPVSAAPVPIEAPAPALPAPAIAVEEGAAVEQAIFPVEAHPATVTAASTIAPETAAPEAEAIAVPITVPEAVEPEVEAIAIPTTVPEAVEPEPEVTPAPPPPPKAAAPAAKTAAPPSRTTVPKAPPPRPPRRPTSRG